MQANRGVDPTKSAYAGVVTSYRLSLGGGAGARTEMPFQGKKGHEATDAVVIAV